MITIPTNLRDLLVWHRLVSQGVSTLQEILARAPEGQLPLELEDLLSNLDEVSADLAQLVSNANVAQLLAVQADQARDAESHTTDEGDRDDE